MLDHGVRQFILLITFSLLSGIGLYIFEEIEGSKILTSEHIDLGFLLIFYSSIYATIVYLVLFLPFVVLFQKFYNKAYLKFAVFAVNGVIIGVFLSKNYYSQQMVKTYNLTTDTVIYIFTIIGLLFAIVDIYTSRKLKNSSEQ